MQPTQTFLPLRKKHTDIETTLDPIEHLIDGKPDSVAYVDLMGNDQHLNYKSLVSQDPYRLPMPVDREGYDGIDTTYRYWAMGHTDWLNVQTAVSQFLGEPDDRKQKQRLLDFGGATGRFLRHAWAFGRDELELWGCDFAPANVNWTKRYLAPNIKFFLNSDLPHLPFSDGYFDVVTAFSVLTHIDQLEDVWLLELRRITKENGLLYITIQNDETWLAMRNRPEFISHFEKANQFDSTIHVTPEIFSKPIPLPRIVFRMSRDTTYNCNVWFSSEYVMKQWSRFFKIHRIVPCAHNRFQSVVLMSPA